MRLSRRIMLATAAAAAVVKPRRASAATVIDTITLLSTSGSTVAANAIPPMFGLQFKKGDVPSGTYPQLQATDGTPWGVTFVNKRSWSDGSWKCCGVLPGPFPKAITTGGVTANILNGGSAPASSGLTNTQLYNELIQTNLSGFAGALGTGLGLSGDWAAKLANDANNVEVVVYGDGQGGRLLRVLCHFQQSGTPHGQLECYFYVQQLLDSVGGLAGYRVLPRVVQPWYNVDTPTKTAYRGISAFSLQYGAGPTTITPPWGLTPATVTWISGTSFNTPGNNWYRGGSENFDGDQILYGYFTTTGTLPPGISTNTLYWMKATTGTQVDVAVALGGGGTGTHTFTPCQVIGHFGTLFGAGADGRYNYIQGAGSVATDAPVRITFNATNRIATRCIPPVDLTLSPTPTSNPATHGGFTYAWDTQMVGPLFWDLSKAGERRDIGLLNTWQARHLVTQTQTDELYVRMIGLSAGFLAQCIRDVTTRGPVNVADPANSYIGVPASLATSFLWFTPFGFAGGFTPPTLTPAWGIISTMFFSTNDHHHQPHMAGYAYLVTGEPQYLDMQMEIACAASTSGWDTSATWDGVLPRRNPVLNSTNYYAVVTYESNNEVRKMAWAVRELAFAEGMWPDSDPAGTQIGTLLHDLRAIQYRFANLWLAAANSYLKASSYWVPLSTMHAWAVSYMTYAACLTAALCEDAEAVTWLNSLVAHFNYIGTHFTYWQLHDFYQAPWKPTIGQPYYMIGVPGVGTDGNPITSDDEWISGDSVDETQIAGIAWTVGASPAFNWIFGANHAFDGFVPTNGDKTRFSAYNNDGTPNTNLPGNIPTNTSLFAVNVSGANFDLALTPGGTPITITGSNSSAFFQPIVAKAPTSTGIFSGYPVPDGYMANFRGSMNYMITLGIGNTATLQTDTETRHSAMIALDGLTLGTFYQPNPKYAYAALSPPTPPTVPPASRGGHRLH